MNPSKERADDALHDLRTVSDRIGQQYRNALSSYIIRLQEFIEAAKRKLPYEKSFNKEKK